MRIFVAVLCVLTIHLTLGQFVQREALNTDTSPPSSPRRAGKGKRKKAVRAKGKKGKGKGVAAASLTIPPAVPVASKPPGLPGPDDYLVLREHMRTNINVKPEAVLQTMHVPVLAEGMNSQTMFMEVNRQAYQNNSPVLDEILTRKGLANSADHHDKLSEMLQTAMVQAFSAGETEDRQEQFGEGLFMRADLAMAPMTMAGNLPQFGGRRLLGLWDDIVGFFKDVGCGAFATGALAGYLASYAIFHACNNNEIALSHHQKFFANTIFQSSLLNEVKVGYSACMAPGFGSAAATTMGKSIFVRGARANEDTNPTSTMSLSSAFRSQTRLLFHELAHSKQYKDRGWNIASFGWDYLFNYCDAGFSYNTMTMETSAETFRNDADNIMSGRPVAHFKKWRRDSSAAATGYATDRTEDVGPTLGGVATRIVDLSNNALSQRKEPNYCVRILRGAGRTTQKSQAEVPGAPWTCVDRDCSTSSTCTACTGAGCHWSSTGQCKEHCGDPEFFTCHSSAAECGRPFNCDDADACTECTRKGCSFKKNPAIWYEHFPKACVNGANIRLYNGQSLAQCEALCDAHPSCAAIEYGVNYGGAGAYSARDCQLQSASQMVGCDGSYHNLDLYVKKRGGSTCQPICRAGSGCITRSIQCNTITATGILDVLDIGVFRPTPFTVQVPDFTIRTLPPPPTRPPTFGVVFTAPTPRPPSFGIVLQIPTPPQTKPPTFGLVAWPPRTPPPTFGRISSPPTPRPATKPPTFGLTWKPPTAAPPTFGRTSPTPKPPTFGLTWKAPTAKPPSFGFTTRLATPTRAPPPTNRPFIAQLATEVSPAMFINPNFAGMLVKPTDPPSPWTLGVGTFEGLKKGPAAPPPTFRRLDFDLPVETAPPAPGDFGDRFGGIRLGGLG